MYWYAPTRPQDPLVLSRLSRLPAEAPDEDFRPDLVARVRAAIAAGTYDSPDKWEAALDNLLQRLEQG
jgi:hypothetical protein